MQVDDIILRIATAVQNFTGVHLVDVQGKFAGLTLGLRLAVNV